MIINVLVFEVEHAAGSSGLCGSRVVHDYEAPFRKMRPIHHLPESGQLPFAPGHTYLEPSSSGILVSTSARRKVFRYRFRSDPGAERTFRLHWAIRMQLYKVGARGEPIKALASRNLKLGVLSEAAFNQQSVAVSVGSHPGLFRVDLVFKSTRGKILGRYQEYLRVVPRSLHVKLGLEPKTVRPGETVTFRVENRGTDTVTYGEEFVVERFSEGRWQVDPMTPTGWRRALYRIGAGLAGMCQRVVVPADSIGKYRIVKRLTTDGRQLLASFSVN